MDAKLFMQLSQNILFESRTGLDTALGELPMTGFAESLAKK
jgi:hypothetical protein